MKEFFLKFLLNGTTLTMTDKIKSAIAVSNFYGLLSLVTITSSLLYAVWYNASSLYYIHISCFISSTLALWLINRFFYDSGRVLIHFSNLIMVFTTLDSVGLNSGYDAYYLVSISMPFLIYTFDEKIKSTLLSLLSVMLYMGQYILGDGLFFAKIDEPPSSPWFARVGSTLFTILIFIAFRWKMNLAQAQIDAQNAELVQNSNLIALGEMSAGISHEINNPLQTLSLQSASLRRAVLSDPPQLHGASKNLEVIDRTINRISLIINGLKDLSRDASNDPVESFRFSAVVKTVLNISHERLKNLEIDIQFQEHSPPEILVLGKPIHLSQVLLNLINNSIDAINSMDAKYDKWIVIETKVADGFFLIHVTDSGKGIPEEVAKKIMQPFFTTKDPGKGTGLGLSISKTLIEKIGGKFYYDASIKNTCFVIVLPIALSDR